MKAIVTRTPGGLEMTKLQKLRARQLVYVISIALLISLVSPTKADEIYKCNDENAHVVFSDKPCSQAAESIQIKNPYQRTGGVRLRLFHNGQPFNTITNVVPHFALEIRRVGDFSSYFRASPLFDRSPMRYNQAENTYSILMDTSENGSYAGYVAVDTNTENPVGYPGDYWGAFMILSKEMNSIFDVSLDKMIHLLQPQDNDVPLLQSAYKCENIFSIKGPLRFLWESLGPNVQYVYEIKPLTCKPACCLTEPPIVNVATMDTFAIHDLPVNKENEIYSLTINAWDTVTKKHVGTLISYGARGYAPDYRFRIVK